MSNYEHPSHDWRYPVEPRYSQLFAIEQQDANRKAGKKPQAYNTPFRYSDSGKCGRYLGYAVLGYEGEEFDMPSTFVTGLGTLIHEQVQAAIGRSYPDAMFEIASQVVTSSGHTDGLIPDQELGLVQYELKTMGGTAYKHSIGLTRSGIGQPSGPRYSAVLQAALNAKANGCDTIVIGHIALEAVSRQAAERAGLSETQRFISEWIIPKAVWEPLAEGEVNRQLMILEDLEENLLPDRIALDDEGTEVYLDPTNSRYWQCSYCSMRSHCERDGSGRVPVTINK
jgi:hypothetical protein